MIDHHSFDPTVPMTGHDLIGHDHLNLTAHDHGSLSDATDTTAFVEAPPVPIIWNDPDGVGGQGLSSLDMDSSSTDHAGMGHFDPHQRLGTSATFSEGDHGHSPGGVASVSNNAEVTWKDSQGHTHEGTVTTTFPDNTFKVQGTDGQTYDVAYSQIGKVRSK